MSQPKIICLMGPTASGKTDLAVTLCEHFSCDIISVDSALIYRGMDIGTAKPEQALLVQAPHRLIDILEPNQAYSAAQFREDAIREIEDILQQQRVPLLVGGTMLYFRALQYGLAELPAADEAIRAQLLAEAEEKGWGVMHQRLQEIDPEAAQKIHPNDPQRLQRALEVYAITGKSLTELQQAEAKPSPYDFINIALAPADRAVLHNRIEARFKAMLEHGFIDEVTKLYQRGDLNLNMPAMRAVGYRQVWQYLAGELTYEEMVQKGIVATRQLAKRQLTWLRGWDEVKWFDSDSAKVFEEVVEFCSDILSK